MGAIIRQTFHNSVRKLTKKYFQGKFKDSQDELFAALDKIGKGNLSPTEAKQFHKLLGIFFSGNL